MVLNGFDSVKAIKAIAMGNYSRRRKLKWLFEFFVFLFLVSRQSSLFSLAGPVLSNFFRRIVVVLNSHIFVFMVFHAMLFIVYSLSRLTDNKSSSNRTDASGLDGRPSHETAVAMESAVPSGDDFVAEILVVGEKNREMAPVIEDSIAATPAAETAPSPSPASPVPHLNSVTETAEIVAETKRFRRTESERFEENPERSKFRRSKTEVGRRESGGGAARFLNSVDEMDIDDFNRTVERFIAEQKMHIGGRITG